MKNRKTIAFLLTLAMLISCFPLAASAGEITQGKLTFYLMVITLPMKMTILLLCCFLSLMKASL